MVSGTPDHLQSKCSGSQTPFHLKTLITTISLPALCREALPKCIFEIPRRRSRNYIHGGVVTKAS
jgi:hypothetical protein